jgi:hypothetical protein
MWRLGLDSESTFDSPSTKTPRFQPLKNTLSSRIFGGEPKRLVDGIAVTANTYAESKKIVLARYGDTNRIIQAHLDFLENLPPANICHARRIEQHIY